MMYKRLSIPSTGNFEVPVDALIPAVCEAVNPDIRRPAVVIFPGGGYHHLSERESEPVALRFLALGFNAFVVRYRVNPSLFPAPQQDAAAAIAYIRKNASSLSTDPDRIAVMGFSAGGHLAGSMGVFWNRAELWAEMGLAPEDVKPNALALCYAVLDEDPSGTCGTYINLTGSRDPAVHETISITNRVTPDCPPAFLWQTFNDPTVPVRNTLMMAKALAENKIPAEVHIFQDGPHGISLANEQCAGVVNPQFDLPECQGWPELAAKFLKRVMPEAKNA